MATGNIATKLQSEITCFVCSEFLVKPVTLDCGHNFCHACIVKRWGQISDQTICPQCKVVVPRLDFKPNEQLANAVQLIRQLSDQAKRMTRRSKTCEGHEPEMCFCKDDLVPICVHCDGFQEHEAHDLISLAEAAEVYKGQFLSCIKSLKKEKKVVMKHLSVPDKENQGLFGQVEAEKKKLMDGFHYLRQLVLEQSTFWLTKAEEVKREITLKKNYETAVISKELFVLDYMIQNMVEKCDQPELEFLEEVGNILEWYKNKKKFENPMVLSSEIKRGIRELQNFSTFLPLAVKKFEETLESAYQLKKQNESTALEPDPTLKKRWKLGETCQDP